MQKRGKHNRLMPEHRQIVDKNKIIKQLRIYHVNIETKHESSERGHGFSHYERRCRGDEIKCGRGRLVVRRKQMIWSGRSALSCSKWSPQLDSDRCNWIRATGAFVSMATAAQTWPPFWEASGRLESAVFSVSGLTLSKHTIDLWIQYCL